MNKKLSYPVTALQLNSKRRSTYLLWDGEVIVSVLRNVGAYGHYSAAIVVEYIDNATEVFNYNGFFGSGENKPTLDDMNCWIAKQLTRLATGTHNAVGDVGSIQEYEISPESDAEELKDL